MKMRREKETSVADESNRAFDPHFRQEEAGEDSPGEMGFFEHLEELRWRIIKALLSLVVTSALCGIFYDELWQILLYPATRHGITLQNLNVFGQITLTIQVCLLSGFILGIPLILYQFWAFIKPGLYRTEQKYVGLISVATMFAFLIGVVFAYFMMIPASLEFAADFQAAPQIDNNFTIEAYFGIVLGFILASGAIFEMPVLSWALSRLGIVTPKLLTTYRRHAVVVLLIVAAIVTPTPDPVNQLMMAGPLYVLYEVSIFVSRIAVRQRGVALQDAA